MDSFNLTIYRQIHKTTKHITDDDDNYPINNEVIIREEN